MPDNPTIFVVDDDEGLRNAIRWLLTSLGLEVVLFDSAKAFLAEFQPGCRGCVVLDVRMPGMSGLRLQNELKALDHDLPIIIITGHGKVPMAVDAMKDGAFDFLEKPFRNDALIDCVHRAIELNASNLHQRAKLTSLTDRLGCLTLRERQVFDFLVSGETNKSIAIRIGTSPRTVEVQRANILLKLGAKSLADLIAINRG